VDLYNALGTEYIDTAFLKIKNNSINTGSVLSQYTLEKGKNYYLKISILKSEQKEFEYELTIDNANKIVTSEEKNFENMYAQWKQEKSEIKLDSNLNAVVEKKKIDVGALIIVTGSSDDKTDALWKASQELSKSIFNVFVRRGFPGDDIYWINAVKDIDVNHDGIIDNVVDSDNLSVKNFYKIIEEEKKSAKKGPLFIYMVDHGSNFGFKLSSKDIDGDGLMEIVYSYKLGEVLKDFQDTTGRKVIAIIEACKSGGFAETLVGDNIVAIASAKSDELSYIEPFGKVSFTKLLSNELLSGDSIGEAFDIAKTKLKNLGGIYEKQNPAILGDEGIYNTKVGGMFVTAGVELGEITDYFGNNGEVIDFSETSEFKLWLKLNSNSAINKVWAVVIPPYAVIPTKGEDNFTAPDLSNFTVELNYNNNNERYEGIDNLSSYKYNGEFDITYYAEDVDGIVISKNVKVEAVGGEANPKCDKNHFNICSSKNECEDVGGYWWSSNECKESEEPKCSKDNLSLCKNEQECKESEGYWYNNKCNSEGQQGLEESSLKIKSGWNLKALPADVADGAGTDKFNKTEISTIWKWGGAGWQIWSPKSTIMDLILKYGITKAEKVNAGEGFWINASGDTEVNVGSGEEYGLEKVVVNNGWNLVGVGKDTDINEFNKLESIKTVWKWSGSSWDIWSPDTNIMNLISNYGLTSIEKIEKGEGFWVNK
jgi:hypothetical protein